MDDQDPYLIRIIYAPINFRDVMVVAGKVNLDAVAARGRLEECFMGIEYVGIDNNGRRVMGMCENRYVFILTKQNISYFLSKLKKLVNFNI